MSDLPEGQVPIRSSTRRRRADAQRSVAAILDSAAGVLTTDPSASVEQIATAAGVSRQTVYAHFSSRDDLIEALFDRATTAMVSAFDAADLDALPADEALVRFVQIGFDQSESTAALLLAVSADLDGERDRQRHQPVLERLDQTVRRGQRDGALDVKLPPEWICSATVALAHAAGELVRSGVITPVEAGHILTDALKCLFKP